MVTGFCDEHGAGEAGPVSLIAFIKLPLAVIAHDELHDENAVDRTFLILSVGRDRVDGVIQDNGGEFDHLFFPHVAAVDTLTAAERTRDRNRGAVAVRGG